MLVDEKAPPFLGDEALRRRLVHCKQLPSPPGVAIQILELSEDDTANFASIADVISKDPALAAKVLRIANSPVYAKQRSIDNLRQAIMVLGLDGTLTLALSFSLLTNLHSSDEAVGLDYKLFWRRSMYAACACRLLGKQLGVTNTEEYFLAGLLSDLGMLALDKIEPGFYPYVAILQNDHPTLKAAEQAALGVDHARIGAWLLEHWKIPARWVTAVAASHDPDSMTIESDILPLARCAAIASDLSDLWGSELLEPPLVRASERASQWFGLDQAAMSVLVESLFEEVRQVAPLFEIDCGDAILMQSLMEEAKELLMTRALHQLHQTDHLQQQARSLENRTSALEQQSRLDVLTGVYNRAFIDTVLRQEFEAAKIHGWPLALLFIDLDHFKDINDTYGHQAGDKVLRGTAQLLYAVARETDYVARYGGEEFLVVLPGTNVEGALAVSERLLNSFRSTSHKVNGDDGLTATGSIGIVVQGETGNFETAEKLLNAADRALYAAKFAGRDQLAVYSEQQDS